MTSATVTAISFGGTADVPLPDVPELTDEVGSGSARTFLMGSRAEARVNADFALHTRPVASAPLQQKYFSVDLDPYTVQQGKPQGRPDLHCRMYSRVGIGAWEYSDVPPAPVDVNPGATIRWLPLDSTFVQDDVWSPAVGGGFDFQLQPQKSPYLDTSYSWAVRGGDEVEGNAVVFAGDSWMLASDLGWSASAFTVVLVAVFHANEPGARTYGILSSFREDTETVSGSDVGVLLDPNTSVGVDIPTPPVDWGIRYRSGTLQLFAGSIVVSHAVTFPLGRPVLLGIAMDSAEGKLFVVDRTKSSRSFSTAGMNVYDQQLIVGRQKGRLDSAATAQMDVLELDWFDRALGWDEFAEVLHTLDSAYGIVG